MPINSKDKGKRAELELAHIYNEAGFVTARRSVQYCGSAGDADVVGVPGLHLECKHTERLNVHSAMEQAIDDSKDTDIPVVNWKKNYKPWLATLLLPDFIEIYQKALKWDALQKESKQK